MAVLTGNYEANEKPGTLAAYNLKGSGTRVYKGALAAVEDANGWLVPAGDTPGITFVGVAYEAADTTAGEENGAAGLRVRKTGSYVYRFQPGSGADRTQAVVGKKAYAVDDNTVALQATTANDVYVGDIVGLVGADKVRVRIDRAAG